MIVQAVGFVKACVGRRADGTDESEEPDGQNVVQRIERLRRLFPEAVTDRPLDLETNQTLKVSGNATRCKTFRISPVLDICLDEEIDAGTIESLKLDKETTFVCLDTALDDSQKHNLAERCLLRVI